VKTYFMGSLYENAKAYLMGSLHEDMSCGLFL
jgi:hypothetical protein